MCMQCVANSAIYVGGAVGALQVLKVKARRRTEKAVPPASAPAAEGQRS